jgi:hypothetical protein
VDLKNSIGFGIAGNFAGHLEQAGEAKDFQSVAVKEATQPKAIFPFYVPAKQSGFLSTFPISNDTIVIPKQGGNVQIEPEVAVYCKVHYEGKQDAKTVARLEPLSFGAYNDCSIRRPNAKKISEKKNWGASSKGLSANLIAVDQFAEGGLMDAYRIACFLKRDGEYVAYGEDSAVKSYSYFHQQLLDWVVDRMNHQVDEGPMEHIASHLANANYPESTLISIGATRYTAFGETHYLQAGDQSIVVVYNAAVYAPEAIVPMLQKGEMPTEHISMLVQDIKQSASA